HEWSACDPGKLAEVDLDDRRVWEDNNPALEVGRLLVSVVEGERSRYSDEGFARERLGVWDDPEVRDSRIIPESLWFACADRTAKSGDLR
ncbi:hypothetical protein, partial [Streptomyces sp. CHA16]|uniref:hypothetical protein n=1 Tax=Streptomyces sp. CHA16 TaxID=2841667 RepID=UPI0020964DB2